MNCVSCPACRTQSVQVNLRRPWAFCSECGARLRFLNLDHANRVSVAAALATIGVLAAAFASVQGLWPMTPVGWFSLGALPTCVGWLAFRKVIRYDLELP